MCCSDLKIVNYTTFTLHKFRGFIKEASQFTGSIPKSPEQAHLAKTYLMEGSGF